MDPHAYDSPEGYDEPGYDPVYDAAYDRDVRNWAMALHLSQFAGYAIPFGGFLVPILIWLLKKEQYPELDDHGREVMNWILSELIYGCLFALLVFVVIGVPLLILLGIVGIVFPIIGAIKASDGRLWRYPGTIRML